MRATGTDPFYAQSNHEPGGRGPHEPASLPRCPGSFRPYPVPGRKTALATGLWRRRCRTRPALDSPTGGLRRVLAESDAGWDRGLEGLQDVVDQAVLDR